MCRRFISEQYADVNFTSTLCLSWHPQVVHASYNKEPQILPKIFCCDEYDESCTKQHTQVRPSSGTAVYPHMPILRVVTHMRAGQPAAMGRRRRFVRADSSDFGPLGSKVHKQADSLTLNGHAKFDAASFIIGREIRNRTNTHTQKQTVTDISTPYLWACVDNKPV